jgi:hypothetical protein
LQVVEKLTEGFAKYAVLGDPGAPAAAAAAPMVLVPLLALLLLLSCCRATLGWMKLSDPPNALSGRLLAARDAARCSSGNAICCSWPKTVTEANCNTVLR